jgi:hypothetical protein
LLLRATPDPGLSLTAAFQDSAVDPQALLGQAHPLNPVCRAVFEAAHLIPGAPQVRRDPIGILLARRFRVPDWPGWTRLFGPEYAHANATLIFADTYFPAHTTPWLAHQDAFNEVLFRALQAQLTRLAAPGALRTTQPNGDLIDYGRLIQDRIFKQAYSTFAASLITVHKRRNRLPTSHAYQKRGGGRSLPLGRGEPSYYRSHLTTAYRETIRICRALGV